MYTAFIEIDENGNVQLPPEEYHHLIRVRRAKAGDRFRALHPSGGLYLCRLDKGRKGWEVQLLERLPEDRESPFQITLAQALIKKDKFEWVIQKAVELGVYRIVPIVTDRTEVKLSAERHDRRLERWHKILREAVKQSRRTRVPLLSDIVPLHEFLPDSTDEIQLVFDENARLKLRETLERFQTPRGCTIFVGPEGGWSEEERALFTARSAVSVWLGPRILRSETAPVTITSILQYSFGDI